METTPVDNNKESSNSKVGTISMVVEKWEENQVEQLSPVHRINGYPWRLRIHKDADGERRHLSLICDKSKETELWQVTARTFTSIPTREKGPCSQSTARYRFASWSQGGETCIDSPTSTQTRLCTPGVQLSVRIAPRVDGESWRRRPFLDPLDPRDGVLVIGEEKKKIHVNKKSLASQSPFFDTLFYGDFQEKNMNEIRIGDVEYKEFANIIGLMYWSDDASLTDENFRNVLLLADRFDLKIVEDRVISFLLSSESALTIHQKLLISDQYNLPVLKDALLTQYTKLQLREATDSAELRQMSFETVRALMKKCCEHFRFN